MSKLSALAASRAAPAVAMLAALAFFSAGGLAARDRRQAREAAQLAAAEAAKPKPPPIAALPPPPAPAPPAPQAPLSKWDRPAPPCVADGCIQHARMVGPGVAHVVCEGKAYQCVVTVVRDQVGFNCAEVAQAPTPRQGAAGQDTEHSL